MNPIAGSSRICISGAPVAGNPAALSSVATALTPDHDCASGPPGAAHAEMTSWARPT